MPCYSHLRRLPVVVGLLVVITAVAGIVGTSPVAWPADNPYVVDTFVYNGKLVDKIIVPGRPPAVLRARAVVVPKSNPQMGINVLEDVPALDWCYGCSATTAAMMFGWYDTHGYPNMYAGPTNGGLSPDQFGVELRRVFAQCHPHGL